MPKEIRKKAHAKINLGLDITGRRADGYHLVRMVMQQLSLHDDIHIQKTEDGSISIKLIDEREGITDALSEIPLNEKNLMYRAAVLMKEYCGITEGFAMTLTKRIPAAAGLAGGSADAAAVLSGINELLEHPLLEKELMELGLRIGADVPYCIMGGTALAEGIGEELTKLPMAKPSYVLLAKPGRGASTKEVYEAFDSLSEGDVRHVDTAHLTKLLSTDIKEASCYMGNVLEPVTAALIPEIADIKEAMYQAGAYFAQMSGSGPTVFGLFSDKEAVLEAYTYMDERREVLSLKELICTDFREEKDA